MPKGASIKTSTGISIAEECHSGGCISFSSHLVPHWISTVLYSKQLFQDLGGGGIRSRSAVGGGDFGFGQ